MTTTAKTKTLSQRPNETPAIGDIGAPAEGIVVSVATNEVRTAEPFTSVMPMNEAVRARIADDMRANGFDPSRPLVIWKERDVLVEGHMRLAAAKDAGLEEVPVVYRSFADQDEAEGYAYQCQRDRRNMTDAVILHAVINKDRRAERGGDRRNGNSNTNAPDGALGRTSKKTAALLGISFRKVERVRTIIDRGDAKLVEEVQKGSITINAAYEAITKPKNESKVSHTEKKSEGPQVNQAQNDSCKTDQDNGFPISSEASVAVSDSGSGSAGNDTIPRTTVLRESTGVETDWKVVNDIHNYLMMAAKFCQQLPHCNATPSILNARRLLDKQYPGEAIANGLKQRNVAAREGV